MPSSSVSLLEAMKKRAAKLRANGQAVDFKRLQRMELDSGTTTTSLCRGGEVGLIR
jgi:hypothetical protein